MRAFEVFINGHRLGLAGIGGDGVLNVIVDWCGTGGHEYLALDVGGLDCTTDEHLDWHAPSIGVGTEVLIRVVEAATVDPPVRRHRPEPATAEQYRKYLRELSERLTEDQRRQLLRELIADLERTQGK